MNTTAPATRPAYISPLNLVGHPVYIGQHVWFEEAPGAWIEYRVTGYAPNGQIDADLWPTQTVLGQTVGGRFDRHDLHARCRA